MPYFAVTVWQVVFALTILFLGFFCAFLPRRFGYRERQLMGVTIILLSFMSQAAMESNGDFNTGLLVARGVHAFGVGLIDGSAYPFVQQLQAK